MRPVATDGVMGWIVKPLEEAAEEEDEIVIDIRVEEEDAGNEDGPSRS